MEGSKRNALHNGSKGARAAAIRTPMAFRKTEVSLQGPLKEGIDQLAERWGVKEALDPSRKPLRITAMADLPTIIVGRASPSKTMTI